LLENLPFANTLPETKLAIKAAMKASKFVKEIYNKDFTTSFKENQEPITEADIGSNKIIENALSTLGHPILSEESSDKIKKRISSKKVWIVDPLDGTTDFVNKTGDFTIMIGLVDDHNPIMGVICQPIKNALYIAQKGQGAFQSLSEGNWESLKVSNTTELIHCKAVGSRFHRSEIETKFMDELGISKFTSRGSSMKVIDICQAKAELYFTSTNKMKQWDTCASFCIVSEAGGKMTDMAGQELKYNTKIVDHQNGILVTNESIHQIVVDRFAKFVVDVNHK